MLYLDFNIIFYYLYLYQILYCIFQSFNSNYETKQSLEERHKDLASLRQAKAYVLLYNFEPQVM